MLMLFFPEHPTWMALYNCADVPLRNYSLTHYVPYIKFHTALAVNPLKPTVAIREQL